MQGIHDVDRELWWAYGLCYGPTILCYMYAAEYKHTDDPSKMTFHEPFNHDFVMTASNLVVWCLLAVVNWNLVERKLATGGRLLILRGVQFGPRLFPDLVMLHNHAAPLIDLFTSPGGSIPDGGAFLSHGSNFPWSPRGFGTLYWWRSWPS